MALKAVTNANGDDISGMVDQAASAVGMDPVVLLALLYAESGLNPRAERWGRETNTARAYIANNQRDDLKNLIDRAWADISFGYSQRIVWFHDQGDHSPSVDNCLAVRQHVFDHPDEDILAAAQRLRGNFSHPTCDGTPLSAMVVYNAGSDLRSDSAWMRAWAGNVYNYQQALQWAEQYRADPSTSGRTSGVAWTVSGMVNPAVPLMVTIESVAIPGVDMGRIWAVGASAPGQVPQDGWHKWHDVPLQGNNLPHSVDIPLGDYQGLPALFVVLEVVQGGMVNSTGNPYQRGYDPSLLKEVALR